MIPIDALAAMRRANQVYHEQLSERKTLSCGVAFFSERYNCLPYVNQLREAVIPTGGSMSEAFDEVNAFYSSLGLTCNRWVPAVTQPAEPVEAFLTRHGYERRRKQIMELRRIEEIRANPDVRILPARAMRAALREIILQDPFHPEETREAAADATLDQLDEPRFEMSVAMLRGAPAGFGALLEAGEIGAIYSVVVLERFQRQGVARTLMKHLLALSQRLALRTTVLEIVGGHTIAESLYRQCGFETVAGYSEFVLAPMQE